MRLLADDFEISGGFLDLAEIEVKNPRMFILNRMPATLANPGQNRVVECESPSTTAVLLNGAASVDNDIGDEISHYQWFNGASGVSNQASVTINAPLGTHHYRLHVYDRDLASDSREQTIQVVDSTAPTLEFERDEWCLWPPNHDFALFKLGQDIPFTSTDRCDATQPSVKIVQIRSCGVDASGNEVCGRAEAVDARGAGATAPDIRFGPTAACVRAERTGTGAGRICLATIEARDAHGNVTRKEIRVTVPHDSRGRASCKRAEGLDEMDARCEQ